MQVERLLLPGGRVARAFVLPESSSASVSLVQYHLIVVPGNPGVGTFYVPFAQELQRRIGGAMSVRSVTLGGFAAEDHFALVTHQCGGAAHTHRVDAPRFYSLQEECQFLLDYLTALTLQLHAADELSRGVQPSLASFPADKLLSPHVRAASSILPRRQHRFILLAHSIGAYISLEAMSLAQRQNLAADERVHAVDGMLPWLTGKPTPLPAVRIQHSVLLFPFIRMDVPFLPYWSLRLLLSLRPVLRVLLVRLFQLLPLAAWRLALRWTAGITAEHAVRAVRDTYTNQHLADAAMHLAQTEFEDVRPPAPHAAPAPNAAVVPTGQQRPQYFDLAFLSRHAARCTLYYAGGAPDIWGPVAQMRAFQAALPGLDAHVVPGTRHAWCAYTEESRIVAERVAKDLERLQLQWMAEEGDGEAQPQPAQPPAAAATAAEAVKSVAPASAPITIASRL